MKSALVTGGASGIGRAIADRLRADGNHVAIVDLAQPNTEFSYVADVTDRAAIDTALHAARSALGPITILVNAAGMTGFRRFKNITFEEWSKVVDVNLNGVFHVTQAVLPDMLEAGWGRIVNISSSSTHSGSPFQAHYVAAKSAVNGLTKSLALEYGFIDTPMLRKAEEQGLLGGSVEDNIAKVPVGRVGTPEDIAAACAFLVSEEAGYITGQIIGVNGGRCT